MDMMDKIMITIGFLYFYMSTTQKNTIFALENQ